MKKWNIAASAGLVLAGAFLMIWGIYRLALTVQENVVVFYDEETEGFLPYNFEISEQITYEPAPTIIYPTDIPEPTLSPSDQLNNTTDQGSSADVEERPDIRPQIPSRIMIPGIELEAPVIEAPFGRTKLQGNLYEVWSAPNYKAAGWQTTSARLGEIGNTVLVGHHNTKGEVFRDLEKMETGDTIEVVGETNTFKYVITNRMIVPERSATPEERLDNARWILPSNDERLTLITCWPYDSNSHRLILVAAPLPRETILTPR
jgi:sortase A